MIFELTHTRVSLRLEDGEPIELLKDLQSYLSYNDTDRRYEMLQEARGDEIGVDHTKLSQLEELAYMCSDTWYQNFLCYTINLIKKEKNNHFNFVRKHPFTKMEMSNGYKTAISIDYVRRKTIFEPGLLRIVILFMQDHVGQYGLNWGLKVEDKRVNRIHLTDEPVYEYNGIELREEQREAIDKIRQTLLDYDQYGYLFSRIMMDLSVNFGKTYTLYILSKNFTDSHGNPAPVIWFYSDRELLSKAVADYLELEPDMGVIAADKNYVGKYLWARGISERPSFSIKPFTVAMIQTVHSYLKKKKLTKEDLSYFLIGLYDECHKGGSPRVKQVLDQFQFSALVGASGSPTSSMSGQSRYAVTGQFGSIRHQVSFKDTVEIGRSLELEVRRMHNPILVKYPTTEYNVGQVKKFGVYHSEQRYELLKYALTTSLEDDRQTLIYGGSMQLKYLKNWYERLKDEGFDLDFTSGDDPGRIRKISNFSERKTEVMMSNRIVGTGIDISTIGSMIYLVPTDNEIDIIQAPIGRLGRVFRGKGKKIEKGIIWDFFDDDSFMKLDISSLALGENVEAQFIPGELTRISQIRSLFYKRQQIPIIDINPLGL